MLASSYPSPAAATDLGALIAQTAVQPRPYQQRIVGKAVGLFADAGLRSVLIESPTGSGKTVMGLLVARALQERLGIRVGWVAMRRYLLDQARAENDSRRIGVNAAYIGVGVWMRQAIFPLFGSTALIQPDHSDVGSFVPQPFASPV